ncbi:Phage terminase small subunit P27 family [Paraburkholderia sacchari]|uniref:phage terminase small subunit P27 family n=1 Tax=Paraburkholderia sacchari TaxID=159450 RepID=UPI0039A66B46
MARPRKPAALHVIDGTYRRDRQPRKPVVPKAAVPTPPEHVKADPIAFSEWNRLAPELNALRLLTQLDCMALAALCTCYARWVTAEKHIAAMAERDPVTSGLIIKTSNGSAIQNPLVGTANKALATYTRIAREFGMTPASRASIDLQPHGGGSDTDADLANRYGL